MITERKYFVSLGAGTHQLPLIQAARRMGLSIIAVDRNPEAPGFRYADLQIHCSITRPRTIVRMIEENLLFGKILGVASRSFGSANRSAAILAERFGTPTIQKEALRFFTDKRKYKTALASNGVRIPDCLSWRTRRQKEQFLKTKKRLIARPAIDGHGKLGIQCLQTEQQRALFLKNHPVDDGSLLVEERIGGSEVTVLGYVENGRYHTLSLSDKIVSQKPPYFAEIMHRYPSTLSPSAQRKIVAAMRTIVKTSRLKTGPIVAEFIVSSRDEPVLVECAPEVGGEFIADFIIPAACTSNYFETIVRLFSCNETGAPSEMIKRKADRSVIIRFLLQRNGTVKEIRFPERLTEHPGYLFSNVLKFPGSKTSLTRGNLDRVAVFAIEAPLDKRDELERDVHAIVAETIVEYEKPKRRARGRTE